MAKIFQFSNKSTQMTYNFGSPYKQVVVTKGVAVVDDEPTAEVLESILNETSLGMFTVEEYDPAIHNVTAKVHTVTEGRADPLVNGILQSGILQKNPAVSEVDDALAMALTQGQDAVNQLVADNPDVLEPLPEVPITAALTIKLNK